VTQSTYFRCSFVVPIAFPAVLFSLGRISQAFANSTDATEITKWSSTFLLSLYVGGPPYLLFLGCVFLVFRGRYSGYLRHFTIFAPIANLVVFFLTWAIYFQFLSRSTDLVKQGLTTPALYYGSLCLAFGYFYVILVHAIFHVLRRMGRISTPSSAA
jgi:hypothetical protein